MLELIFIHITYALKVKCSKYIDINLKIDNNRSILYELRKSYDRRFYCRFF